MVTLFMVADDFTGALDSGVHFASAGIATKVIVSEGSTLPAGVLNQGTVLVVDAETRHIPAAEAHARVRALVTEAKAAGVPYIYKKTDSGMRGNVGAELAAAYEACGCQALSFVPAFPKMNRTTKNGICYIDQTPVSQSDFGKDPFEPVRHDAVRDIIREGCSLPVSEVPLGGATPAQPGIHVYDCSTDADIAAIGDKLKAASSCGLLAGCAGFASILPSLLNLPAGSSRCVQLEKSLFFICGSINRITVRQVEYGQANGFPRVSLEPEQKLEPSWWNSPESDAFIKSVFAKAQGADCMIVDTSNPREPKATDEYAKTLGLDGEQTRTAIARSLGLLTQKLLSPGPSAVYLMSGGDTLLGFMRTIGKSELEPICELSPGCVLTALNWNNAEYHIITKSGGFGKEDLLVQLVKKLRE